MTKIINSIKEKWYIYLVSALFLVQALVFMIFRQDSYLQIHDNLDLFMSHYQMMKVNNGFFAQNTTMPMLHGVDRDLLGSEFLLYNLLYIILPGFWAYMAGYALKIAIGMWSFNLLFKDILGDNYKKYSPVILVTAAAFGLIPVFPTYGIAFTSVPLIIFLLRRLYIMPGFKEIKGEKGAVLNRVLLYVAVFCYPFVSYFSYHGFFILCYMCVAILILWAKDKKFPLSTFLSVCILSLGYMTFEYRLFKSMLFDDTVTIRTTMDHGSITFLQAMKTALDEFINASFHSEDSHTYIIFWVVLIGILVININHIRNHQPKKILAEPANLLLLWAVFNVLIYGLYQFAPFRELVETLVPKLTGFEFARTAYFNTFIWYALLAVMLMKLYDMGNKYTLWLANAIAVAAIVVVMLMPQVYNDFYYTVYNQAYKIIKHRETSTVNYREFYSTKLFDRVKDDIDYQGEWSAAYGFHPGILQYNGIATVDGYLGMYPEEYKQKWIAIEEPAFEGSPSLKSYFEGWGARVSLYSGSDENTYAPLRYLVLNDNSLSVDLDELKTLDCRYIFSRIEFDNADEIGINLIGTYEDEASPYTIFVYDLEG